MESQNRISELLKNSGYLFVKKCKGFIYHKIEEDIYAVVNKKGCIFIYYIDGIIDGNLPFFELSPELVSKEFLYKVFPIGCRVKIRRAGYKNKEGKITGYENYIAVEQDEGDVGWWRTSELEIL